MAAIFEIFWKVGLVYFLDTLGVENFDEIALTLTVKKIEAFLCFRIFCENLKIQNGRHFWKCFEKLSSTVLTHPGGRKFWRNRSNSNG